MAPVLGARAGAGAMGETATTMFPRPVSAQDLGEPLLINFILFVRCDDISPLLPVP